MAQKRLKNKQQEYANILLLQRAVRQAVTLAHWPWYRLWQNVRELIPIVLDRRKLAKLEMENVCLTKVSRTLGFFYLKMFLKE